MKKLPAIVVFILLHLQLQAQNVVTVPLSRFLPLCQELLGFPLFESKLQQQLDSLAQSKDFIVDTVIQQTDTTAFYFRGYWKHFNPFSHQMDTVRLYVTERRFRNKNTKQVEDVRWYFQTQGVADKQTYSNDLKEIFRNIHRKLHARFFRSDYFKYKPSEKGSGEIYRYSVENTFENTASISWYRNESGKGYITFSFIVRPVGLPF